MTAKLTTETGAARDAILENLPVLRGRLEEQGYQIASFQVEVADNHGDINSGNNLAQHSFDQSQGQAGDSRSQATDYRRLAMMQRQQMENAGNAGYALPPRDLGWEMMAGIDLHA